MVYLKGLFCGFEVRDYEKEQPGGFAHFCHPVFIPEELAIITDTAVLRTTLTLIANKKDSAS